MQSHRAVVEQTIGDLKRAKILFDNKVQDLDGHTKNLDCVLALHNLSVLLKADPGYDLRERRKALKDEHVFKPLVPPDEVNLNIPNPIVPRDEPNIQHIRAFEEFLTSAGPSIRRALETGRNESVFFPTVSKRGRNLFDGAYVLQLRVQKKPLGEWALKWLVGASYSVETHEGYAWFNKDNIGKLVICDCIGGYVMEAFEKALLCAI